MASESPTWRVPSRSTGPVHTNHELLSVYEAEEERLTSVLCRKLEQLREEKLALENGGPSLESVNRQIASLQSHLPQPLIEAMRVENAQLRSRVADLERELARAGRVNDGYRQELLELRRRLGIPYDSLIGLGGSASGSVSSSPVERRVPSGYSRTGAAHPQHVTGPSATTGTSAMPIPRVQSQTRIHPESLPSTAGTSTSSTPSSPSYSLSPTAPFFPHPSSQLTTLTTPASVPPLAPATPLALASNPLTHALTELASANAQRAVLSYPSVPPPSLASSLGSGSPLVPTLGLRVPPNSRRQSRGEREMVVRRRDEDELEEIDEAYSDEEASSAVEIGRRMRGLGLSGT